MEKIHNILNSTFLQNTFLGNALEKYLISLVIFLVLLILLKIIWTNLLFKFEKLSKKTKTNLDNVAIKILKSIKPSFYFIISLYISLRFLTLSELSTKILNVILLLIVVYQVVLIFQVLINLIIEKMSRGEKDNNTKSATIFLGNIGKWILWFLGILIILSNLGIDITSLIAGLGIGGIAIAFALQNILADLFSSFAIYFDKPFVIGDSIKVGDKEGTVTKIGIKTTRIKSFRGEEIVFSNRELTSSSVQNFGKLKERRVVLNLGIIYETEKEKLESIPSIAKNIIESVSGVKFGRTHFKTFEDSSLNFEIVYYVLSDSYDKYMDVQQEINLKIKEKFDSKKIEFAYPTKTIYNKQ